MYFEVGIPQCYTCHCTFRLMPLVLRVSEALRCGRSAFDLPRDRVFCCCSRHHHGSCACPLVSVPPCSSSISYMPMHRLEDRLHSQPFACMVEPLCLASLFRMIVVVVMARVLYFPPRFASRNSTFFLTDGRVVSYCEHQTMHNGNSRDLPTGSYLSMLRGRWVRGRRKVMKKPVMAIDIRRTATVLDFAIGVVSI